MMLLEPNTQHFPPLPKAGQGYQIDFRPLPQSPLLVQQMPKPFNNSDKTPQVQEHPLPDEGDLYQGLVMDNPVLFLAFLTQVIQKTIATQKSNETIDTFQIITDAAGDQMV